MKFLAYFGHLNIDIVLRTSKINPGGSSNIDSINNIFGGTAGNFAMVAHKLGVPFDLFGAVSEETHGGYMKYLSEQGISTEHISVSRNTRGPMCYIVTDGLNQQYFMHQGPMENWDPGRSNPGLSQYRYVHFSTGPLDRFIEMKTGKDSTVVLDPGQEVSFRYPPDLLMRAIKNSGMLIVNSHESEVILQLLRIPPDALWNLTPTVIVTAGPSGVDYSLNGRLHHQDSVRASKPLDTIGAGDAFRAGLYMGLWKNLNMHESIFLGQVAASRAVETGILNIDLTAESLLARLGEYTEYGH